MTDFTESMDTPESPTTEKKTPWKIIIPVAILLVLCCICLVVVGVLGYMGTQGQGPLSSFLATATPTITPSPTPIPIIGDWDLYYDWSCDGNYNGPAYITFYDDYSFYLYEDSGDLSGTWYAQGDFVEFIFDGYPYADYTSSQVSENYMEGDMITDDDQFGCWYAER
jgi:hypothetical protein